MNVVQNYLVSILKAPMTLYETRILCRIVLTANDIMSNELKMPIAKKMLGKRLEVVNEYTISVPVNELLTHGSHDYQSVVDSAKSLQDKVIEYYDTETAKWEYHRQHLLTAIDYTKGSGVLRFTVSPWLLSYILDFICGNFSMYDFNIALRLPSTYAIRLYWLTCSMNSPVTYTVQMLRDMFGTGGKYRQNRDFIKRCIEDPRKILEKYNCNGYTYKVNGRGSQCSVTFYPVVRQEKTKEQLTAMAGLSAWVTPQVRNYLLTAGNFNNKELGANKSTLMSFCQLANANDLIVKIVERARKKRANKGYIINAMKSAVKENKTFFY